MTSPTAPDVSVVIPAYNRADLLERCLTALEASEDVTWEATVVDNASPEELTELRARYSGIRWLRSESNLGYAGANNLGLRGAGGRYICWLNSDAEVEPGTLATLVAYMDRSPRAGAVTPCNLGTDGLPQSTLSPEHGLAMAWLRDSGPHLLFPNAWPFREWHLPRFDFAAEQRVATSQTTCFLIRTEAYRQVGEMDEELFLFYNDVDYCRRLRNAGWEIVYLPDARVLHHGSASVETAPWKERQLWSDRYRFFGKWYGLRATPGVRLACITRGLARVLAQLAKGRPSEIPHILQLSRDLYRALD